MWSDRKQEDSARPDLPAGRTDQLAARAVRATGDSGTTANVGKGMVIKGQIRSGEHMHVDGEIEGTLYLSGFDLTVTTPGKIHGNVSAREVDSAGTIEGNVDATKKITVRKGGRLLGDLRTPGIVIEDGAYFKGKIEIVSNRDEAEPSGATKAAAASPVS
jgi:cytoskeletal protein CcmA (bactofilin family)